MHPFFIKTCDKWQLVEPSDILWISKSGSQPNYLNICTLDAVFNTRMSLSKIERILPREEFLRIHKSYVVSLKHIRTVSRNFGHVMVHSKRVPIGESYVNQLRAALTFV